MKGKTKQFEGDVKGGQSTGFLAGTLQNYGLL
jgi:hypothetical protein